MRYKRLANDVLTMSYSQRMLYDSASWWCHPIERHNPDFKPDSLVSSHNCQNFIMTFRYSPMVPMLPWSQIRFAFMKALEKLKMRPKGLDFYARVCCAVVMWLDHCIFFNTCSLYFPPHNNEFLIHIFDDRILIGYIICNLCMYTKNIYVLHSIIGTLESWPRVCRT